MGNIIRFDSVAKRKMTLAMSVSVGTHRSHVQNVDWPWPKLLARLQRPDRDPMTLEQFKALSTDRQLIRKNNGYFVGSKFKFEHRRNADIEPRSVLTLDIDKCSPELLASLLDGTSGLGNTEYAVYSTRKHSPEDARIRVVIPLSKLCPPDKFVPVMRYLAHAVDPKMETVDPVSFRAAQFMYWPSHCADQEPLFHHNDGAVLDVDGTLKANGWSGDYSTLPKSAREQAVRDAQGGKADPRLKKNFVGAFCRAYDCREVISNFLPDVYEPTEYDTAGDPTRYTFKAGTTSNGLVVYDDGLFVSSFQGSDPVGAEANPNAFDLARIHMFAHLDEDLDPATPARDRPSYLAMKKRFQRDPEVRRERMAGYEFPVGDDVFDDIPLPDADEEALKPGADGPVTTGKAAKPEATSKNWEEYLDVNDEGYPKATLPNLCLILEFQATFKGRFAYDEFISDVVQLLPIKSNSLGINLAGRSRLNPFGRISERTIDAVRKIVWSPRGKSPEGKKLPGWGLRFGNDDIAQAIRLTAERNPVHPVRDWLTGLEGTWDGKPRVETLWTRGCHTEDTAYYRNTARILMVAAVARVFEPGCKYDDACIIEGPQGSRKSTFVRVLGHMWSGETEGHFADAKKFVESTLGFWIIEIPELVQFGKSEIQAIKATLSRQGDHVRLSYKKFAETFMRQSVMIGTTNEDRYLRDNTGARRFLPIKINGICDVEWLKRNVVQMWAEALHIYRAMRAAQPHGDLPLYQVDDTQARAEQNARLVDDGTAEWAGMIEEYVNKLVPRGQENSGDPEAEAFAEDAPLVPRASVCAMEVAAVVFSIRGRDYDARMSQKMNRLLRDLPGWEELGSRRCGGWGRQRQFRRVAKSEQSNSDDL